MGDPNRPALGFEYQIALALIDTTKALTFAETTHPDIVGDFEVILVTRNMRLVPPVYAFKPLRCGYNPAAQIIPTVGQLGLLNFEGSDRPNAGQETKYAGQQCVARIVTSIDGDVARTQYANYYVPAIEINSGAGEDVAALISKGFFVILGEE